MNIFNFKVTRHDAKFYQVDLSQTIFPFSDARKYTNQQNYFYNQTITYAQRAMERIRARGIVADRSLVLQQTTL